MIQTLRDEASADVQKRDECKDEYQKIKKTIADLDWKIEKNEAKITKLEDLIAKREEERLKTIEDIADVIKQLETMKEERTEENTEFLKAKSEDEQAIELLKEARDKLEEYGKKHLKESKFLQQGPEFEVSEDKAPDAKFSDKGSRQGESRGVVSIMTMLIEDLSGEIRESVKDEEKAQLAYEASVKAAKKLKGELEDKKVSLEEAIAKRKEEKTEEEESLATNEEDKTAQEDRKAEIKEDCDFIIDNFEERSKRRTAEMDGLAQAKDFLAGYQANAEGALLQGKAKSGFDDAALAHVDFVAMAPAAPRALRAVRRAA